jgi:hypothetical protein
MGHAARRAETPRGGDAHEDLEAMPRVSKTHSSGRDDQSFALTPKAREVALRISCRHWFDSRHLEAPFAPFFDVDPPGNVINLVSSWSRHKEPGALDLRLGLRRSP